MIFVNFRHLTESSVRVAEIFCVFSSPSLFCRKIENLPSFVKKVVSFSIFVLMFIFSAFSIVFFVILHYFVCYATLK